MKTFSQFNEENDERNVRLANGEVCGQIIFRTQADREGYISMLHVDHLLNSDEKRKVNNAGVVFRVDPGFTAHLGAPVKWVAPNGVLVVYARGQRRNDAAEKTGEGTSGTYHDFNPAEEWVIPATRNDGAGRRALRAWANEHMGYTITARMQARQMVRPGD